MQLQATIAERHAQALGQLHAFGHFLAHGGFEKHRMAAPLALGAVHGHIGKAHQVVAGLRIVGIKGNAHAGTKIQRQPVMLEGDGERRQYLLAPEAGPGRILTHQQHHEFVATQACQHALAAQLGLQPPGDLPQQLIACGMAVTVIDGLEVVEIKLQQGQCFAVGLRQLELLLQLLAELPAIVEAGQGVLGSLELQALLHLMQLRHIAHKGYGQTFVVIAKIAKSNVHRHGIALLALQPQHAAQPHGPARWLGEVAAQVMAMPGLKLGRQQHVQRLPFELAAPVA